MTDAIDAAINSSLDAANFDSDTGSDAPADPTPAAEAAPAAAPASADAPAATEAAPAAESTPSEVEEALAELGIKPPLEGQRENRIPYSRVLKIQEKAAKKLTEKLATEHAAKLKELESKYAQFDTLKQRAELLDRLDQIATDNPDGYMEQLARSNPAYAAYKKAVAAAEAADTVPVTDPKPTPDAQFPDGTVGYTPEQHDRLLAWHERQTEAKVAKKLQADFDKRLGPIEKDWQANETRRQLIPHIQRTKKELEDRWGADMIAKHEDAIGAAMAANPRMTPDAAAAHVLLPIMKATLSSDQNAMREKLLKEINARPAAAQKQAPAHASAASNPASADPVLDAMKEAMAAAGL